MGIPIRQGEVLAERYRVDRVLGEGGMGVVVAARHVQLDTLVAIKFMRPEALLNSEAPKRFLREARAAARLRGQHIARVTDYGTLETGEPYLVAEYLDGEDLGDHLAKRGSIPYQKAVHYIIQACEGLDEAHRAGIIHRDIKPSNLFLARTPNGKRSIKVLDFGISKLINEAAGSTLEQTSTQAILGSPLYMSPEQLRSARDVDARADLWSLGATLYELIAGQVPFKADSMMELCFMVANEEPPPLLSKIDDLPPELEEVLKKCLAKDRQERFATARQLMDALIPFGPSVDNHWAVEFAPSVAASTDRGSAPSVRPVEIEEAHTQLISPVPAQGGVGVEVATIDTKPDFAPADSQANAGRTQISGTPGAPAASSAPAVGAATGGVGTDSPWSSSQHPARSTGSARNLTVAGIGVGGAAIGLVLYFMLSSDSDPTALPAPAASSVPGVVERPAPPDGHRDSTPPPEPPRAVQPSATQKPDPAPDLPAPMHTAASGEAAAASERESPRAAEQSPKTPPVRPASVRPRARDPFANPN